MFLIVLNSATSCACLISMVVLGFPDLPCHHYLLVSDRWIPTRMRFREWIFYLLWLIQGRVISGRVPPNHRGISGCSKSIFISSYFISFHVMYSY
ncbi:hypothetical protein F5Y02DRAFT_246214 [Annulohypoxylon stygium]|nr:hypothetical protein F5Y02DRAFT_246214 [Annulohypoxylon stygium]